ncbi:universal stress protein [Nonomuraea sp. NPDC046570]|uniref:universal stress protein n=1 Tax=Nonomuraea sp. NPDC046570 TaxID=3155255 RepID=UPI00340AE817
MERVIVGFDGSRGAVLALAWAAHEAELHGAELLSFTVMPQRPVVEDALLKAIRQTLQETGDIRRVRCRLGYGAAAAELSGACTGNDLLVVGSRGRNQFTGMLLGSVSRACLHHAPCSVTVVPDRPQPQRAYHRVIAAVDGSLHARFALRQAAQEAALRSADLLVVHAVYWDPLGVELMSPSSEQLHAWGEKLVAGELAFTGLSAEVSVVDGHPADVLTRLSSDADLLVLGSRGHNPLSGLLLGSTSDYCAQHAVCPVMIARSPRTDT